MLGLVEEMRTDGTPDWLMIGIVTALVLWALVLFLWLHRPNWFGWLLFNVACLLPDSLLRMKPRWSWLNSGDCPWQMNVFNIALYGVGLFLNAQHHNWWWVAFMLFCLAYNSFYLWRKL